MPNAEATTSAAAVAHHVARGVAVLVYVPLLEREIIVAPDVPSEIMAARKEWPNAPLYTARELRQIAKERWSPEWFRSVADVRDRAFPGSSVETLEAVSRRLKRGPLLWEGGETLAAADEEGS